MGGAIGQRARSSVLVGLPRPSRRVQCSPFVSVMRSSTNDTTGHHLIVRASTFFVRTCRSCSSGVRFECCSSFWAVTAVAGVCVWAAVQRRGQLDHQSSAPLGSAPHRFAGRAYGMVTSEVAPTHQCVVRLLCASAGGVRKGEGLDSIALQSLLIELAIAASL